MKSFNIGNCKPLDNINILHYFSSNLINVINLNSNCTNTKSDLPVIENKELERYVESYINDYGDICKPNDFSISNFIKEVAINYPQGHSTTK